MLAFSFVEKCLAMVHAVNNMHGVVQANVGQKPLYCNIFKSFYCVPKPRSSSYFLFK
jgi:hypothetical protein